MWYAIDTVKTSEFETASETAAFINSQIDSSYSVDYSFSSDYFTDRMTSLFKKYEKLSGIILVSTGDELQFMKLTDSRIIGDFDVDSIDSASALPVFKPLHPFMKSYESKLYFSNGDIISSTVIFNLLDRSLLFPVLRNTLVAAVIYLILSIILLMTMSKTGESAIINKQDFSLPSQSFDRDPLPEAEDEADFEPEAELPETLPDMDTDVEEDFSDSKNHLIAAQSGMYSERSGLVWEHFLSEKLDAELKRAASFDQDSCLAFISVISPSGFIPYRNISELIVQHFSYKDLAFESGENTFCVIIPEKDIDEGQIAVENFTKNLISRFPDSSYKIYAGLTSRNSRLLSEKRMIQEAKAALKKAEEEKNSTTISFRTDLNKYREYIATTI